MWKQISKIIERLVRPRRLDLDHFDQVLGTELRQTQDTGYYNFYEGECSLGAFSTVDLRLATSGDAATLILFVREGVRAVDDRTARRIFGDPDDLDITPEVPPAGQYSRLYRLRNANLWLTFDAQERVLRSISLMWGE